MQTSPARSPLGARERGTAVPAFDFEESELDRFRDLQQSAYACAERVAARLAPGVTERQAAELLRRELAVAGAGEFLRRPFARFGERTAGGSRRPGGDRRLTAGMPYILGGTPLAAGCTASIGYSGRCGANPVWDALAADLPQYRELVLREVRGGSPLHRLGAAVEELAARHGYRNANPALPGGVIGRRISRSLPLPPAGSPGWLLRECARMLAGERPADLARSRGLPPGLWAVTPRLAFRGVGVTFEELLVVTEDSACWLDDDLPHVRPAAA